MAAINPMSAAFGLVSGALAQVKYILSIAYELIFFQYLYFLKGYWWTGHWSRF